MSRRFPAWSIRREAVLTQNRGEPTCDVTDAVPRVASKLISGIILGGNEWILVRENRLAHMADRHRRACRLARHPASLLAGWHVDLFYHTKQLGVFEVSIKLIKSQSEKRVRFSLTRRGGFAIPNVRAGPASYPNSGSSVCLYLQDLRSGPDETSDCRFQIAKFVVHD